MRFVLVLFAIVLLTSSLTSIFFTSYYFQQNSWVGHATTEQNASVTLEVLDRLAITLINSTINFGSCAINTTRGYGVLDSSATIFYYNNDECVGGDFPSSLEVKNIGNVRANVSVEFNESGSNFFKSSSSWLAYKTKNSSSFGGCSLNDTQSSYMNITQADTLLPACDNLSYAIGAHSFSLFLKAFINASAPGGGELLVTFTANPVS